MFHISRRTSKITWLLLRGAYAASSTYILLEMSGVPESDFLVLDLSESLLIEVVLSSRRWMLKTFPFQRNWPSPQPLGRINFEDA